MSYNNKNIHQSLEVNCVLDEISPRVGIVIPVYNRCKELSALLNSLSELKYRNFDVLVVDNGSSDKIKDLQYDAEFELLSFSTNYGAIRGFNEGIRHLLRRNCYQYIWLLDSDLTVNKEALGHSVRIMKNDPSIGICVSIIYNIFDKDIVVEAGGHIDLKNGIVSARFGNELRKPLPETEDVDYASCGMSLLRAEMIEQLGLYDERYHFLWEDMDYGLYVKKQGWRVVVSSQSELYHPPFTEKRNPNIYAYYDVRNPLLTVAKFISGFNLPLYLYSNLQRYLRIALLMMFSGCRGFARLTFKAIVDFIFGHFGKADLLEIDQSIYSKKQVDISKENTVYIVGTGSRDSIGALVNFLKINSHSKVCLIAQDYRKALFEGINVDQILTYDDRSHYAIREYLKIGIYILLEGGGAINTDLKVASPLGYFGRRGYDWDSASGQLYRSRQCFYSLWKPVASVVLGYLFAIFFLPAVWIAALIHKRQNPVIP